MDMFDSSIYDKLFGNETQNNNTTYSHNNNNMTNNGSAQSSMAMMYGCDVSPFPKETPIGMAYVPYQKWEKPYDEQVALERGTMFPSLDKPFIGEEAVSDGWKR